MRRVSVLVVILGFVVPATAQRAAVSSKPDTPFKLATFEAAGKTRIGLVLGARVLDVVAANAELTQKAGVPAMRVPSEMRDLIEAYPRVSPRLYQIANYFKDAKGAGDAPFGRHWLMSSPRHGRSGSVRLRR